MPSLKFILPTQFLSYGSRSWLGSGLVGCGFTAIIFQFLLQLQLIFIIQLKLQL